ncbi:MAG: M48 family metallopeptidase [Magnetococcales bacterium]|nr:M48 family metallopeptidase [Magnetococcales bacterium]
MLRRSKRRQRLTVAITHKGEVELRLPGHMAVTTAEAFLAEQGAWIMAQLDAVNHRRRQRSHLLDGAMLPLLDRRLRLCLRRIHPARVRQVGGEIWAPLALSADPEQLEAALEQWYRQRARHHLLPRLAHWAAILNLQVASVSIRGPRTRWGSCSAQGRVNLNWRLMWLPEKVVDYVLIHELCHRQHMNHSPAFWSLVEQYIPDWRLRRHQLRQVAPLW